MIIKSLNDEDKIPIEYIIKVVKKKMVEVIRVVDALNLGRTEVKSDGVYRSFNDGSVVKIASGDFKRRRVPSKRIKLF